MTGSAKFELVDLETLVTPNPPCYADLLVGFSMPERIKPEVRSWMMSRIAAKDTDIEMTVRRYLHACGFRFRLHQKQLPGNPDLVLKQWQLAVFVHGCFWHGHRGCAKANAPKNRAEFWAEKLGKNAERDRIALRRLADLGWRTAVVWGCALEKDRLKPTLESLAEFVTSGAKTFEGAWNRITIT